MGKRAVKYNPGTARLPGTNQELLVRALALAAAIASRNPDAKAGHQPCGKSKVNKKTILWRSSKFTPASSKVPSRAATPSSERSSTPSRNLRARQSQRLQEALKKSQKTIYQRELERKQREKQLQNITHLPSPPPTDRDSETDTDEMLSSQKAEFRASKIGSVERHNFYHGGDQGSSWLDIPRLQPKRKASVPMDGPMPIINSVFGSKPQMNGNGLSNGVSDQLNMDKMTLASEMENCHFCQLASFSTHSLYPIQVTNDVDDATFPPNFRFIEHSVLTEGVHRSAKEFRCGCTCEDGADCTDCYCAEEHGVSYVVKGRNKGCLKGKLSNSRQPIFECHEACKCGKDCPNRIVDNGRKIPLEIFRTKDRGWGVRCKQDIPMGTFIDKYVGEILTQESANARRSAASSAASKDVYLFALDKFLDANSDDIRYRECYEVDGEYKGSVTRFINHSCDPNCRIFARVGDISDQPLHDLAFFAVADIPAGTELSFDYTDGNETPPEFEDAMDVDGEDKKDGLTVCLCGSENCRGYLW